MRRIATAIFAAALTAWTQSNDAERMLNAALDAELVDVNLSAAIKQYRAIVAKFSKTERTVAARALMQIADCQRKLGEAEARKTYERVLREFKDQKEAAALAQARLEGKLAGMTSRLLWRADPAVGTEGTVSFDGRHVSFVDWKTGNLMIRDLRSGLERRITDFMNSGRLKVFAPESAISRDGKQVAFSRADSNGKTTHELWIANLAGETNPRRIWAGPDVDGMGPRDWSPDGTSIVVSIALKDKTQQLALVSVANGSLRVLKTGSWDGTARIFFSPDGKFIAYDRPEKDNGRFRDVFVMAVNNAIEVPAVERHGTDIFMGWSPNGKHLLFTSDRTGTTGLWSINTGDREVFGEEQLIMGDVGDIESVGVSSSGALHYWRRIVSRPRSNVWLATLNLAAGRLIGKPQEVSNELESNYYPVWSPDGKFVAYISVEPGAAKRMLVVRSADSGRTMREVRVPVGDFTPLVWSEDGLYGVGRNSPSNRGIYRVNVETGAAEPVYIPQQPVAQPGPRVSRDGRHVFFGRALQNGNEMALIEREAASGKEREIMRREWFQGIGVSQNSQYIVTAGIDRATNSRTALLISVASGEAREVLRTGSDLKPSDLTAFTRGTRFWHAEWTPGGRSFLMLKRLADETQDDEVWEVPLEGSPRKLDFRLARTNGTYRLQPGGSKIAWSKESTSVSAMTNELWALENFVAPVGK